MEIAAILLTLGVAILVGLYLYAPLLERKARHITHEEHELSALMAERDRAINSLQELEFDFALGKIPEGEYPTQRAALLQKGADILRNIDSFSPQADSAKQTDLTDDDIESMVSARRKTHKDKSAGFCPKCGKPIMASDKFCPSCGEPLT